MHLFEIFVLIDVGSFKEISGLEIHSGKGDKEETLTMGCSS